MSNLFPTLLVTTFCFLQSSGFYLPGVAPKTYKQGDVVKVKANSLESSFTELPYDFYSLPVCTPQGGIKHKSENLGEILSGDTIQNSPFDVQMMVTKECVPMCRKVYKREDISQFISKINDLYRVNLIVDNLPAAQKFGTVVRSGFSEKEDFIYEKGYPLGFTSFENGKKLTMLNNHVDLIILYHEQAHSGMRIVGFEVVPRSVQHHVVKWDPEVAKNKLACRSTIQHMQIGTEGVPLEEVSVVWSYSVNFEPSQVQWAVRWDAYLKMQDPRIHWFSIFNSFVIVLFLSGMVAIILVRALHKDLRRYNKSPEELEVQLEETGWKLVHADVFRKPPNSRCFAASFGTGMQLTMMAVVTLLFAALGFLSPANRGALMTTLLLLFVFMGVLNGYTSSRLYKMFGETDWQAETLLTATVWPSVFFGVFFLLNLLLWHRGSSGAVPFGTLISLIVLWFGISVPLVYLGAYFGYRKDAVEVPCTPNDLYRMIPAQPWHLNYYFSILAGGVLPFGGVFIEVFFILSSVWMHRFYYMFGFLFLVFLVLLITSAEITIVSTYFQLCAEDYRWYWRSFLTAGSPALYLFLYSLIYFHSNLQIEQIIPTLLYFGYMILVSLAFFLVTGSFGFLLTFLFVKKIYGSIKIL